MTSLELALKRIILPSEDGFCCETHAEGLSIRISDYIREHFVVKSPRHHPDKLLDE